MNSTSILEKKIHPLKQALAICILVFIFLSLAKVMQTEESSTTVFWEIGASGLLFYAMMNSVLSIAYENQNQYWLFSIIGFASLLAVCGGLSFLYSGTNIDEAGSFRWIFLVFTMGYIILLSIVRTMKKIITIAQREDKRLRGEE